MAIFSRRIRRERLIIEPSQVAAWQIRRDRLSSNVGADPDGDWAWLWRTRIKVLDYLLERYTTGPSRTPTADHLRYPTQGSPDEHTKTSLETTSPYDQVPQSTQIDLGQDSPQSHKRKARLKSLHGTNEERRKKERASSLITPKKLPPIRNEEIRLASDALYQLFVIAKAIEHQTEPDNLNPPVGEPDIYAFFDALAAADAEQSGLGLMRQIIAFDLGMPDLPVEILDEQMIRDILAEHGIDPDEIR